MIISETKSPKWKGRVTLWTGFNGYQSGYNFARDVSPGICLNSSDDKGKSSTLNDTLNIKIVNISKSQAIASQRMYRLI